MKDLKEFQWCAERLKALADPERLRIVCCLFEGEKNVGEIAHTLQKEVVGISHHLGVLRRSGIVSAEKHGRHVYYQILPELAHGLDAKNKRRTIDLGCCQIDLC
jgi:DNA-binding transcriptional ArsR family regulator